MLIFCAIISLRQNEFVHFRWGRSDIMEQLRPLNPRVTNISGETPFHVAAKEGQDDVVETMLEIFGKDVNINQQNRLICTNIVLFVLNSLRENKNSTTMPFCNKITVYNLRFELHLPIRTSNFNFNLPELKSTCPDNATE